MKALVWEAPRSMAIREQAIPPVEAGEALLKVAYAGICGSELSGYLGHNALRVPPLVMGHELAGEVVALGDGATAHNPALAEGQHVTVNPLSFCGACEFCAQGLPQLCVKRKLLGAHRPGAFAEYVAVPAEQVLPLPEGLSLRAGALAEPAACGVHIVELAGPVEGADALVLGAGPIGLLTLQILRLHGAARVFIADLNPARLAVGAELGGEALDPGALDIVKTVREATGGRGAAVAVDAVGAAQTRGQCIAAVRAAGTVILSGLHEEAGVMPVADVIRREIVLRGSFCYTFASFAEAIERLARGEVRLDPWIAEAPLEDGGRWFDRLLEGPGDVAKVLLVPA
ncbi:MAG: alcohol dehydrogenase catalytic domain-containing protein [Anaerolineae bacterium]|nr:alcohol dehydrogenase catalytic domain-containing protein [Anaerolineae bacterium]